MLNAQTDSFGARGTLAVGDRTYTIFRLAALERAGHAKVAKLPYSLKILLENLLRYEDDRSVKKDDVAALADWSPKSEAREIAYRPARVLLQDFTGVPCVVDLAAMRDAMADLGGDPKKINPLQPVELVIDHSVQVDRFGDPGAFAENVRLEYERNGDRYAFLKWGQSAFDNFRAVPPDTGIVHQVNIEFLSRVVFGAGGAGSGPDASGDAYPDTVVGTDSHTTMANGLGILAWGVGGIEAEAAMLGQPVSMLIPEVVGVRLNGKLREGVTSTDLVLRVTELLRKTGVVGKFVEFFGKGLSNLTVADRTTMGNMSPEYGSTCAIFPIDDQTLAYLRLTGRPDAQVALVEAYAKEQGMFRTDASEDPTFSQIVELDLDTVVPNIAGPRRPQDRVSLSDVKVEFAKALGDWQKTRAAANSPSNGKSTDGAVARLENEGGGGTAVAAYREIGLSDGAVVIAAITSCTNTSNPAVLVCAGLLAKKAVERGLQRKPWVKTSLAPGSKVVTDYLQKAGLDRYLDALGFGLVGYGCTTCIGNSGPLPDDVAQEVADRDLIVAAVLSGNRNFEGRIHPQVRANYLASPPLCVAYALAGRMDVDLTTESLGNGKDGKPVYLRDLWPSNAEIDATIAECLSETMFRTRYADVFKGEDNWRALKVPTGERYAWAADDEYIKKPSFFDGMTPQPEAGRDITGARVLVMVGDSITTDHISPAGSIAKSSPAAKYLMERGVGPADFNSYGARRGNHEVMARGTFANVRLKNLLVPGVEGGVTRYLPANERLAIFDAAMRYKEDGTPLVVLAGKEYGSGSSRDWAAKGPMLLGIRVAIAESFERIHRSNLIGMGILPLEYADGATRESLGLTGEETFDFIGLAAGIKPRTRTTVRVRDANGKTSEFATTVRIDTPDEAEYFRHGGIMQYVLRQLRG
ncbi:MAG: aconitate hydratase AcnA [Candidatus Eremiobacteraeota bacterium]|nr:aconitate hydratase AcnA [Candidatus Eremiobacteraeota bacterium]